MSEERVDKLMNNNGYNCWCFQETQNNNCGCKNNSHKFYCECEKQESGCGCHKQTSVGACSKTGKINGCGCGSNTEKDWGCSNSNYSGYDYGYKGYNQSEFGWY